MKESRAFTADGETFSYFFERKKVKNINLRIHRDGTLFVSAPPDVSMEKIRRFLISRAPQIRRARGRFAAVPEKRPFAEGDTVFFLGEGYRLTVSFGPLSLSFADGKAMLSLPKDMEIEYGYFKAMGRVFFPLIEQRCLAFESAFPRFVGKRKSIMIRSMKTMWASCRPKSGLLTFSAELSQMPLSVIDTVVAHEYVHFLVSNHGEDFYLALSRVCPEGRELSRRLGEFKREFVEKQ
jgi:predicted metal-dependent hydrolase